MKWKRHAPEQIIAKRREAEAEPGPLGELDLQLNHPSR